MKTETADTENEIVLRMRMLRSTGVHGVDKLHHEAQRVTDWREHVRAQPVIATAAASLLGLFVVRTLFNGRGFARPDIFPSAQANLSGQVRAIDTSTKPTKSSALWSFGSGIVGMVVKQWLTGIVQKQLGDLSHTPKPNTNVERSDASI